MPGPLAADCINWGLHHARQVEDVSVLLRKRTDDAGNLTVHLGAVNGPNYGTVWNADITDTCVSEFGDGVIRPMARAGRVRQGRRDHERQNTTLYASDRDIWLFLADEERRVEVPNRRDGQPGSLARGFYISNSKLARASSSSACSCSIMFA
jgi:hypothetical protein